MAAGPHDERALIFLKYGWASDAHANRESIAIIDWCAARSAGREIDFAAPLHGGVQIIGGIPMTKSKLKRGARHRSGQGQSKRNELYRSPGWRAAKERTIALFECGMHLTLVENRRKG